MQPCRSRFGESKVLQRLPRYAQSTTEATPSRGKRNSGYPAGLNAQCIAKGREKSRPDMERPPPSLTGIQVPTDCILPQQRPIDSIAVTVMMLHCKKSGRNHVGM
jgi:hypothetical protein